MVISPEDLQNLLDRARAHSKDAEVDLVAHCSAPVRALVARCLTRQLWSRFDPDDVVQDVWSDFFAKTLPGESCPRAKALLSFLKHSAMHKVANLCRKYCKTKKHDHGRECALPAELRCERPSDIQVMEFHEQLEHDVQALPPRERFTVILRCEGFSNEEVAVMLRITVRTVRNILERVFQKHALSALESRQRRDCCSTQEVLQPRLACR